MYKPHHISAIEQWAERAAAGKQWHCSLTVSRLLRLFDAHIVDKSWSDPPPPPVDNMMDFRTYCVYLDIDAPGEEAAFIQDITMHFGAFVMEDEHHPSGNMRHVDSFIELTPPTVLGGLAAMYRWNALFGLPFTGALCEVRAIYQNACGISVEEVVKTYRAHNYVESGVLLPDLAAWLAANQDKRATINIVRKRYESALSYPNPDKYDMWMASRSVELVAGRSTVDYLPLTDTTNYARTDMFAAQ